MSDPDEKPLRLHKDAPTCVFWSLEDYPIPEHVDPALICQNIKEAIKKQGYHGEVSIQAYVIKNTYQDYLLRLKPSDLGFTVKLFPDGDKQDRASLMVFDMLLWVFLQNPRHPDSNVIVLFKDIRGEMVEDFEALYSCHYGVLLSETQPGWELPSGSKAEFLTRLFDEGCNKKRKMI